jgi:phage baseplate assembly protein gpV
MLNSRYRGSTLTFLLAIMAAVLFSGCVAEIPPSAMAAVKIVPQVAQETAEKTVEKAVKKAQSTDGTVAEVEIGGGRIVVDGDTIAASEFDENAVVELEAGSTDLRVDVNGTGVSIKRGDVVRFGEKIKVAEGEKVRGSVVAFGGDVIVRGVVTEDAVSIGGDVIVTSSGDVDGSAVSVGGSVTREPGGRIGEDEVSLGPGWFPPIGMFSPHIIRMNGPSFFGGMGTFIAKLFWGKSGLMGFLAQILTVPVLVFVIILLCITIVGIPLLIFVIPLFIFGIIAAVFFGYIGMASIIAKVVESKADLNMGGPYVRIALGVLILMVVGLMSNVLGIGSGPLHALAVLFGVISWMIFYVVSTIGFGAVVMSRFGSRGIEANSVGSLPAKTAPGTGTEPPVSPAS